MKYELFSAFAYNNLFGREIRINLDAGIRCILTNIANSSHF